MLGKFYGVGVGPGSPDLLTLRAVNVLKSVQVVCAPRSSSENERVALRVVESHLPPSTALLEIATPMTRDKAVLEREWSNGAKQIAECLKAGKNVAFITIGDSALFSTYTYLMKKVQEIVPEVTVESIPGITSFSAMAGRLNVPLAEGGEKLAIIPAIDDIEELRSSLKQFSNLILMKVAGKFDEVVDLLVEEGLKNRAVFVSKVGHPDELITFDLDSMRGQKRDYLSLIFVKKEGFK